MPTLKALTKLNAQRWLTEEEGKEPSVRRALKTMQKATGYLAEYVAWLQYRNLVCQNLANPFRELHYPKTLIRPKKYETLTYREICLLRAAAFSKSDDLMVRYIDIARFTGMRLSEFGALTSASIEFIDGIACFRVRSDAKTVASANRLIPISNSLKGLVDLTGLDMLNTENAVGKRFGRLKRQVLQDGDSRYKCFHSIRKFVVTTLEQAGISEGIAADLVGHEKPKITYNVYSNGSSVAQLQQAIHSLDEVQL
jgi:integrase